MVLRSHQPTYRPLLQRAYSRARPPTVKFFDHELSKDDIEPGLYDEHEAKTAFGLEEIAGYDPDKENRELQREIEQLREEIRELRSEEPGYDPASDLSVEAQAELEELLHDERKDWEGVEIRVSAPRAAVPTLKRLNKSLHDALEGTYDPDVRRELWRYYCRSKQSIPSLLEHIPSKAWDVLWKSQSFESPTNPDRLDHLLSLCQDMASAGIVPTQKQKLVQIEARFVRGKPQEALEEWERLEWSDESTRSAYLELGIRMKAAAGEPEAAKVLLEELLGDQKGRNARLILPVISAYNKTKTPTGHRQAFSLYLRLRKELGAEIIVPDYDTVSLSFLEAKQEALAMTVFRDMMLTGTDKAEEFNNLYIQAFKALQEEGKSAADVNAVSLEALTVLPRRFQNKYFYAKWLKKLIGMGEADAAAQVIELMYERGQKPDATHVNGIIGAWLRTGSAKDRERAEQMAWSMIQQRLEFAWRRRAANRGDELPPKPSIETTEEGVRIPRFLQRPVPPATIETFSILVLHYLRREMYGHVRLLRHMLGPAEIRMNSYFMNHLLYADLRSHQHRSAWLKFQELRRSVPVDMETYICLWDCMKVHVDRTKNANLQGFPEPRRLFAYMNSWLANLDERTLQKAKEHFTDDAYEQVVRCFCLSLDLQGTLVALHALKKLFGMNPDEDVVRLLVLQVSRLDSAGVRSIRQRRAMRSDQNSRNVAKAAKVLDMVAAQRRAASMREGVDTGQLQGPERDEENLNLVSEFIRVVLVRTSARDGIEESIEQAKVEMGVTDVTTGDVDSSSVP